MAPRKLFKIILLGDGAVGKTSIKNRYLGKGFKNNYMMTLGADFALKRMEGALVQIWDLAGQPAFSAVRKNYFRGANGALLVYDVVKRQSFQNLEKWIHEIHMNNARMVPSIIVGNKIDLVKESGQEERVSDEEIKKFQEELRNQYNFKFPVIKTSAKTGEHVKESFDELINEIQNL